MPSDEEKLHPETSEDGNAAIPEPVKQLEQRFKHTMERVAELTEEKQKLEHLVLQLQSETETIGTNVPEHNLYIQIWVLNKRFLGEYITLYQKQRAVLHSRAREKEQVFRQLLDQRNQQQEQLHKLKILLSDFLKKEYIHSNGTERLPETGIVAAFIFNSRYLILYYSSLFFDS